MDLYSFKTKTDLHQSSTLFELSNHYHALVYLQRQQILPIGSRTVVVVWFLPPKVLYLKAGGTLLKHFLFKYVCLIWKSRKVCARIEKNEFLLYFFFLTK
jgi:hypothetical protein